MPESEIQTGYKSLIGESVTGLSPNDALDKIAKLIDLSSDLAEADGNNVALQWCDILSEAGASGSEAVMLDYYRANAWGNLQLGRDSISIWSFEQPETQKQIYYLRSAMGRSAFETSDRVLRCRILTNLGNQLSTLGRFVDAQAYWSRALEIFPEFGMALGNRGSGLISYGTALYDFGHRSLFLRSARQGLVAACGPDAKFFGEAGIVVPSYREKTKWLESIIESPSSQPSGTGEISEYPLGKTEGERAYRKWCLQHRLFLNPLNDLSEESIAGRDILSQPTFVTPSQVERPPIIGFFNQMKQEYVSARWHYYEGATATTKSHFSDYEVILYNTLDYPSHCLAVEKVKSAFRAVYSVFDKIAFFVNSYFGLGVPERRVSFRSIWIETNGRSVRNDLERLQNWPLRGLFWLSKDFFDEEFQDVAEPNAKELYVIRNHLEHKFLKIHEFGISSADSKDGEYSINRSDFEQRTLKLFGLCRAALIYLSLAVEAEERRRGVRGPTLPIHLPEIDNDSRF